MSTVRLATGGTIDWGPDCDLCTPNVHLLVTCGGCCATWDTQPCSHDAERCPGCGKVEVVTFEEVQRWESEVLGLR